METKYPKFQCRLDYWFVSCHMFDTVAEVDTIPSVKSDHSAIYIALKYIPEVNKGPGLGSLMCHC
jgi:maleate cis-trans isomerase